MKVVIVGAGAVGVQLARELISQNTDVVLIEKNPEVVSRATNTLDCMVVEGDGASIETLKAAGTDTADFFVACTNSDEVNLVTCGLVGSEFGQVAKIARVRSGEYPTRMLTERRFFGIDYVVNPDVEAADAIARAIEHGAVSDIMHFEGSRMQIRSLSIERESILVGRAMHELNNLLPGTFLVVVIARENRYLIPSGDTIVQPGDVLYLVAHEEEFEAIFSRVGKQRRELRRITLVGGGKIGQHVAESILKEGKGNVLARIIRSVTHPERRSLKIVDRDEERCKYLAQKFPNALVINADISEDGVFEEQHFQNSDLVVATTDNQELNIVTGLYAKSRGVRRAIVLVTKGGYVEIARQLGIDVPVSRKSSLVTTILRFIRSARVRGVHTISDSRIEALQITVKGKSRSVGKPISELSFPRDALIVSLERNGTNLVPTGNHVIHAEDHLIIVTKKEFSDRIQEMFAS